MLAPASGRDARGRRSEATCRAARCERQAPAAWQVAAGPRSPGPGSAGEGRWGPGGAAARRDKGAPRRDCKTWQLEEPPVLRGRPGAAPQQGRSTPSAGRTPERANAHKDPRRSAAGGSDGHSGPMSPRSDREHAPKQRLCRATPPRRGRAPGAARGAMRSRRTRTAAQGRRCARVRGEDACFGRGWRAAPGGTARAPRNDRGQEDGGAAWW